MRTISATYLKQIYEGCLQLGADKNGISALIPGRLSDMDNPSKRFEAETAATLLNHVAVELHNPAIGIAIGLKHRPANLQEVGFAFPFCENLREVMALNQAYQPLIQQVGVTEMFDDASSSYLIWSPNYSDAEIEHYRYFTEMLFAGYIVIGRWLLYNADSPVLSVQFRHSAPKDMSVHKQVFTEYITFNAAVDRVDFRAELAEVSMPSPNPDMVNYLRARLDKRLLRLTEADSISMQVLSFIQSSLSDKRMALPDIASVLGMSERTLRRKLKLEGQSFRSLLTQARKENCEAYLRSGRHNQSEIALMLGFSDHSAYSRAFQGWFGMTPSNYRAVIKGKERASS